MQDIWTGNYFQNNSFVASQFFSDPNTNVYFFEQNYCAFYQVSADGSTLINGAVAYNMPPNTSLSSEDNLADQVPAMETVIILARQATFNGNPQNILNAVTQSASSYINNAISNALGSNQNLAAALSSVAPLLMSPELNFALSDLQTGWRNGQDIMFALSALISSHQANIQGAQDSLQRIKDFKSKILKQVMDAGDSVRKLQGQLSVWKSQNTMQALSNAFPNTFGKVNQLLQNEEATLNTEITKLLPGNLGTIVSGEAGSFISGIFNEVSGGILPVIFNPIDKLFADIEYLDSEADNLLQQIPVDGFGNLEVQSQTCNQIATILDNLVQQFAVSATKPGTFAVTDPNAIFQTAEQVLQQQLNQNIGQAINQTQQQEAAIASTIKINGLSATPPPTDASDSFKGGTLSNLQQLVGLLPPVSVATPTIASSPITLSPDPQIAQSQMNRTNQQTRADAPGTQGDTKRGDCINNIEDIPLKPRSYSVDGSLGDYQGSKTILF